MRKRQELDYVPVGHDQVQRPHKKSGFLIRLLRLIFQGFTEPCACSNCRLSRGEEVAEQQVIKF